MARYMVATKAIHKFGDISREEPDLCIIHSEDAENYIGNWVTRFGFFDVKFPKSTTRELTDDEKERWHGQQISIGGSPVGAVYTKEAQYEETKESLVIVLPDDEARKQQLRDKLVEYKDRMHPYRVPELQMGTICKIAVLERFLRDGKVATWDLLREMVETYDSRFSINDFQNACGVIKDYCKTGGKNLHGGTGLRTHEQMNSKRLRPGYPPMGRKVRVAEDAEVYEYQLTVGMVGMVNEGPYCGGIFDYSRECPVQFDPKKELPETLGVPWEILEFAD